MTTYILLIFKLTVLCKITDLVLLTTTLDDNLMGTLVCEIVLNASRFRLKTALHNYFPFLCYTIRVGERFHHILIISDYNNLIFTIRE